MDIIIHQEQGHVKKKDPPAQAPLDPEAAEEAAPLTPETSLSPAKKLTRVQSLLELTQRGAKREGVRLIGLVIVLASIACIILDVERDYFTNIVSLILGLLVKSPIDRNSTTTNQGTPIIINRGGGAGGSNKHGFES